MKLSICTITARAEPHYEWLIEDLACQAQAGDDLEIIAIDLYDRSRHILLPNATRIEENGATLRRVVVTLPKPTPYQGPHRVTSRDLHAIANARNTALCFVTSPYVAFLDDRVRLGKTWLATIRRAANEWMSYASASDRRPQPAAICGPCDRDVLGVGRLFDDRKDRTPMGRPDCGGTWFYGGNFALPMAWALEVNGCEEATDPVGRQDRVMGMMLANCGHRIDFLIEMGVVLDRKLHGAPHPVPRVRKGVPPADKSRAIIERFGTLKRTSVEYTPNLLELRGRVAGGLGFPMHGVTADDLDWFDARPIGKM
jgi:hypothetical protein